MFQIKSKEICVAGRFWYVVDAGADQEDAQHVRKNDKRFHGAEMLLELAARNAGLTDDRTDRAGRDGSIAFVRYHDHHAVAEALHDDVAASVVIVFEPVPFDDPFQFEGA